MCHIRITNFSCGHRKKTLLGPACPEGRDFNDHSDVPGYCPRAESNIKNIKFTTDCRRHSTLVACRALPRLNDAQRSVLSICDNRVREVQTQALQITRRILIALAQWSGGQSFCPNGYTIGSQPTWVDGQLSHYQNHKHMMDAAYLTIEPMHRMLSTAIATCQTHIQNVNNSSVNQAPMIG